MMTRGTGGGAGGGNKHIMTMTQSGLASNIGTLEMESTEGH